MTAAFPPLLLGLAKARNHPRSSSSYFSFQEVDCRFREGGQHLDLLLCRGAHLHDILTLVQEHLEPPLVTNHPRTNRSVRYSKATDQSSWPSLW